MGFRRIGKGMRWLLLAMATAQGCAMAAAASVEREKAHGGLFQRAHPMAVRRGTLTVDGMTVQTGLSFRIADLRFLFIQVPGAGTAVISDRPFAEAREQKEAFKGSTLTVAAGGSRLQLASANRMRGTHSAFVRFDHGSQTARGPEVGYSNSLAEPVVWVSDAGGAASRPRRVVVSWHRRLREGRLCRPSPTGREKCARVFEVRLHE